ncbi:MAG TPA: trigger factor [Nevskiaceae bacterium]|nr:trigger factor [Nevskiaceae bacterium]
MDVQIQAPGGLQRQMTVRIPAERVSAAVEARLKQVSARARIPGFRPGKAPRKVIEQQYGPSARVEAVSDLVQKSYPEALGKAGVQPAGQPQIEVTAEQPGQPLEYVAKFEVYPEIQLSGLDRLQVDRPRVTIGEADISRLLDNLRRQKRELVSVERAAASGDVVTLDFDGSVAGEAFAGGKAEKAQMEIGSGQYLPDMEQGVIGHRAGETFTIDVAFPADYRAENLRGKTAQFAITLHEVKEVQLPALDQPAFLQAHGVDSAEALRAKAVTALEAERDKAIRNRLKTQTLDQLLAANPVEVPQALIDAEVPRLRGEAASRMNLQNVPAERLADLLPAALFEATARKRVSLGLLIGEVIKSRQIKLDTARVAKALDELAGDFEQPEQVKQYYRSRPELMQGLGAMVLEEQVVESLLAGLTPSEPEMTLEQLLTPPAPAAA